MSNLTQNPQHWLDDLFEYEFCEECCGGELDHIAVPFNGNWFAFCKRPLPLEGMTDAEVDAEIERRINDPNWGMAL